MRVLLTGGQGQLARDLAAVYAHEDVTALSRAELDITNPEQIEAAVAGIRPHLIVNTAAYHQVDRCESEPEMSFLVNAAAPQRLAASANRHGAVLVHISTDYVFDGEQRRPYREDDPVGPLSVYGASKAAGEMAVRAASDRHLIVRTTGLYGAGGRETGRGNFVETMLRLAAAGTPLQVVSDQVMTPSFTEDVAAAIKGLTDREVLGTVHVTNSGGCSWYDFACEIFRLSGMHPEVAPATQAERPSPARRPAYSVLAHDRLRAAGLPELRPWQEALAQYLAERHV